MKHRRNYSSLLEDLMALDEYRGLLSKKEKEHIKKKETPKGHTFTFAEGMILAYLAQFVVGPLYKVALVHWGIQ